MEEENVNNRAFEDQENTCVKWRKQRLLRGDDADILFVSFVMLLNKPIKMGLLRFNRQVPGLPNRNSFAILASVTLFVRYREHRCRLVRVIWRDGAIYFIPLVLLRCADTVMTSVHAQVCLQMAKRSILGFNQSPNRIYLRDQSYLLRSIEA